jgi:class 3 adenylate cyclase/tetratricopeptide (TPR) repeat protein
MFSCVAPYASAMQVCPNCGQENPDGFRFCGSCGGSLAAPSAGREERKVVTVLFADLVGFTSRAERLDPEDVRALLGPYHARLREELERYGGTVEKFIGDAVMALFGAPVAHEDDPERAVRAALAIRDWVRDEEEDLQLRIAVNTGEALITLDSRPEAGEGMASGDVVNTTARLQSAAPVNGILVAETTYRATRDRIEYEAREAVTAKGKASPIAVWEPVRATSRVGIDLEDRVLTPLVGRERELATLEGAFDRAVREREPQLVTLVGVPGIGKSRLVTELFQRLDASPELVWWRQGRALPYGAGVSFWPLAEIVKAQMGIHENDSAHDAARKVRESVAAIVPEGEGAWVLRHLDPLVGVDADEVLDRQESFAAWRRYLEGLAEQRPLVLVFEDLHWADDGVLDFVDHVAEWATGVPILVIGTARPELIDRRPDWGGGKLNAAALALSPLSDADAARVIAGVLEQGVLPAGTQQALLDRAGGNPLYAEQFARLYVERGSVGDVALPEGVQGIIAARLDALSPAEKRVLQDAAVLGKVFWSGGVASLADEAPADITAFIHMLERKGFVRRERRSSVEGETELAFRHVLVREVAYAQVPRRARADKHIAAVRWIESLGRPDDQAELIAHHYAAALELLHASGSEPAPEVFVEARLALRRAGDRAEALNSFASAADYYRRAFDLWPPDAADRPFVQFGLAKAEFQSRGGDETGLVEAADALLEYDEQLLAAEAFALAAEAAWGRADRGALEAHLRRAMELVQPLRPSRSKAWIVSQAARYEMLADRNDEAIRLADEALEMATALDLPDVRVHALNNRGSARIGGRFDLGGFADLEASVALGEEISSPETARALHNLGTMQYVDGDLRVSLELVERAIASAERFGIAQLWSFSRGSRTNYLYRVGRWDEALEAIEQLFDERTGVVYAESSARLARAWIRVNRSDFAAAVADSAESVATARGVGDPQALLPSLATHTSVLRAAGMDADAYEAAADFAAVQERHREFAFAGSGEVVDALTSLLGAEQLLALLRSSTGQTTLWQDAAIAIASEDLDRAIELYDRAGDVTNVAVVQLRAAQQLVDAGRRAEADAYLQPALAFFRSVGATRYVREGEELLAAAS